MSLPDPTTCPDCGDTIEDDEDYRTPDLTNTRYHPECWDRAIRNKGQAHHPDSPSIKRCVSCDSTFDYTENLNMGLVYCNNCAPESADKPTYDF